MAGWPGARRVRSMVHVTQLVKSSRCTSIHVDCDRSIAAQELVRDELVGHVKCELFVWCK